MQLQAQQKREVLSQQQLKRGQQQSFLERERLRGVEGRKRDKVGEVQSKISRRNEGREVKTKEILHRKHCDSSQGLEGLRDNQSIHYYFMRKKCQKQKQLHD